MSKNNMKITISTILIVMLIAIGIFSVLIIALPFLKKAKVDIDIKGMNILTTNYVSNEESNANTWDISASESDNVVATLSVDGILTISGEGEMKNWNYDADTDWHDTDIKYKVREVVINEGVTNISSNAFRECRGLVNITISSSVEDIEMWAFENCINLTNIEMPKNAWYIDSLAFEGCASLTDIKVNDDNNYYSDENGVLYDKDKTELIKYPEGKKETEYIIPSTVTQISFDAFKDCTNLINMTIPEGVLIIEDEAFSGCKNLVNIKIPSTVTSLNYGVFKDCINLASVELKQGIASIEQWAFYGCSSLENLTLPNTITHIRYGAFKDCIGLKTIEIPSSLLELDGSAFDGCKKLTDIKVDSNNIKYCDNNGIVYTKDNTEIVLYPEGKNETEYTILSTVTSIGDSAFSNSTSLETIEIPKGVNNIGNNVFMNCSSLKSIDIPEGVTAIGYGVFDGCKSLKTIKIPEGVTTIGNYAFAGCCSLTDLEIPDSVTEISDIQAFYGVKITNFVDKGTTIVELPEILKRTQNEDDILFSEDGLFSFTGTIEDYNVKFEEGKTYVYIKVQSGVLEGLEYVASYNTWDISENDDESVIATLSEDGVLSISGIGAIKNNADSEFYNVEEQIKSININSGITSIGNSAFSLCFSTESVIIPNTVTSIGEYAFEDCKNLISIEIPNSVTEIGDGAFSVCENLTKVEMPNSVTCIEIGTFRGCRSLTNIEIPYGVTTIKNMAFSYCDSLTNIELPNTVTSIGLNAFAHSTNLSSVKLSESVTKIDNNAFYGCTNLTSIEIPEFVVDIGENVFGECSSLTEIKVNSNNKKYCDDNGVLYTKDKTKIIVYPNGRKDTGYTILNGVTIIGNNAFYGCANLTSVEIPNTVTSIEEEAFRECNDLINMTIPEGVISIGNVAFAYCDRLKNLVIKGNSVEIGDDLVEDSYVVTIACYEGSTVESYAIENEIRYRIIGTSDVIVSTTLTIDEENLVVKGITPKMAAGEIRKKLQSESGEEFEILDLEGNPVTDEDIIGTGYTVKLSDGKEYTIIVWGDFTGDGEISVAELAAASRLAVEAGEVDAEQLMIVDVSMNGSLEVVDLAALSRLATE